MAALKTDYKDAVYTGNRKYTQTNNADGTISLVDATAYSTDGDPFGANDINATNSAVNANSDSISALQAKIKTTAKQITLSASSWETQDGWKLYRIADSLVTADSNQEVIPSPSINKEQYKALQRAGLVGTQKQGELTLWVYGTVPTIDIPITVIFRGEK